MQKRIRVGLIGFGTIGTGVVKLLHKNRSQIATRLGVPLELVRIADIDVKRDRGVRLAAGVLVGDAEVVLADPSIDIVIELMGGIGVARRFVRQAIAEIGFSKGNEHFSVTASIGLAVLGPGDTGKTWLARADAALYEAKSAGRNRVVFAEDTGGKSPTLIPVAPSQPPQRTTSTGSMRSIKLG